MFYIIVLLLIFWIGNPVVELVVFRGVACKAPFSANLLKWLTDVIQQACCEHCNVRVSDIILLHYSSTLMDMF